jgi:DNA-directed RNA polymerase specialized sigma24 family protein
MAPAGSVTHWIDCLKAGDRDASEKLWQEYFRRLVGLARKKLQGNPRAAADEEDVALSAFDSFCRGAEAGRFPDLGDRYDLWQLLLVITVRKASDLIRHERSQRQGAGKVRHVSALAGAGSKEENVEAGLAGREPDPAFAAQVAEQCSHLLELLDDDQLRAIAVAKMEGYTNPVIAGRLGCAVPTVERRLRLVRRIWQQVLEA